MIIIFLILGLIIGSFLNSVVYRLNAVESFWERSHCPKCKKKVHWSDNIPLVSFFLLSARCRDCGEKISWQYPLVELGTGMMFALVGRYFFVLERSETWVTTAFLLTIFSLLLVIFVYDFKYMEIPMLVLWLGVFLAVAYLVFEDWTGFVPNISNIMSLQLFSGVVGGGILFLFFFGLSWYSKETWMGEGDAYLGLLIGLVALWPNVIFVLMLSSVMGVLVSVALMLAKKKTLKSQVPFAPFLVLGTFLTIMLPKIFPQIQYFLYFN